MKSSEFYRIWMDSSAKFDYYLTGGALTVFAYFAKSLGPFDPSSWFEWIRLCGTILLLAAGVLGLKRIEGTVTFQLATSEHLNFEESGQILAAEARYDQLARISSELKTQYSRRSYCLILGLALLMIAQLWPRPASPDISTAGTGSALKGPAPSGLDTGAPVETPSGITAQSQIPDTNRSHQPVAIKRDTLDLQVTTGLRADSVVVDSSR